VESSVVTASNAVPEVVPEKTVDVEAPQAAADEVVVLDYGGQYSQLIARRVRECGVFSELLPHHVGAEEVRRRNPKGLILSGGPASVYADGAPKLDPELLELGIPVLGICYGMQLLALSLGGKVEGAEVGEFGRSELTVREPGTLFKGLPTDQTCWMSHRDTVYEPPPGFTALASSTPVAVAAFESTERQMYGIQFHPRSSTPRTARRCLKTFLRDVCEGDMTWSAASIVEEQVARIREQVGDGQVICGLSGGVDSSVAALLVHKAVGEQLTCVFVDHGLMRKNEGEQVVKTFRDQFHIPLVAVDAEERFLERLDGVTDPETKRKAIGAGVHPRLRGGGAKLSSAKYLVQGTLYSDVIESGGGTGASTIKSHHNVGGLPEDLQFDLVEPLRALFKDEVRAVGAELGPARAPRLAPAVPRPRPGDPHRRRRGHQGAPRPPARRRLRPAGRDPQGRPVPRAVAVLLRAARHPHGRRAGRRAHLRLGRRHPRGHLRRRDDRRLGPAAVRPARADRLAHDQRAARGQPGRPGHHVQAARHHRVGVGGSMLAWPRRA
jgi:GMP synthase (glutamine-hydrolysing)